MFGDFFGKIKDYFTGKPSTKNESIGVDSELENITDYYHDFFLQFCITLKPTFLRHYEGVIFS